MLSCILYYARRNSVEVARRMAAALKAQLNSMVDIQAGHLRPVRPVWQEILRQALNK